MKIVHSFWSKPAFESSSEIDKNDGGFRHAKYHWMSWALSCLTFKELYKEVELVTDEKGKQILIDQLKLPYTKVHVELDKLNHYPRQLWAIGKLYAYKLQDKPFLHVDGDVYCWNRFERELEIAELVGQNVEIEERHYHHGMQYLKDNDFQILDEFKTDFSTINKFRATNAGILGGNNVDFFKEYVDRSFYFINQNLHKVNTGTVGNYYAIIYEQYLFSVMARKKGIKIAHYIKEDEQDTLRPNDFMNRFFSKKFVHLIGEAKAVMECCREVELHLLCDYPEWHERISSIFND